MTKILIATPAYGEMFYAPYVNSVIGLQKLLSRNNWGSAFATIAYADIVESRNFLLTHFYDNTDATHLLFVDADMGYEPKLIGEMVRIDKPIVGVIAPKRQIDLDRLAELARNGAPTKRAIARSHSFLIRPAKGASKSPSIPGFVHVEGCGAGILLIKRDCIKTMLERLPALSDTAASKTSPLALAKKLTRLIRAFDPLTVDGARLSEDFSFCHRWRQQCGGEVWANISHEITHVGLQRFSGRYADAMTSGPRIVMGTLPRQSAAAGAQKPAVSIREGSLKRPSGSPPATGKNGRRQ
jgi:hypothetical protein